MTSDRIIWVLGEPKAEDDAKVIWVLGKPFNPLITAAPVGVVGNGAKSTLVTILSALDVI